MSTHIMQATITYLLTEQAQREQMAATGQPIARKQVRTIDVTPDDLPLLNVAEDGNLSLDVTKLDWTRMQSLIASSMVTTDSQCPFFHAEPDVLAALRIGIAKQQAEADAKAKAEQRRQEEYAATRERVLIWLMATPAARGSGSPYPMFRYPDVAGDARSPVGDLCNGPGYGPTIKAELDRRDAYDKAERIAAVQTAIDAFLADDKALATSIDSDPPYWLVLPGSCYRVHRDDFGADQVTRLVTLHRARKANKDAAVEATKQQYIAAFVGASNDAALQQQFADGLLCREAAVSLIASDTLDVFGPAYMPHFCDDDSCKCGDAEVTCIPQRIYPAWVSMRGKLPHGATHQFFSSAPCTRDYDVDDNGDAEFISPPSHGPKEYSVKLTVQVGPFRFTRRVKLV